MDRAPIAGVDNDAHRLLETRAAMPGDFSNFRRRASVFALSRCQQWKKFREEAGFAVGRAENRHDLCVSPYQYCATVRPF